MKSLAAGLIGLGLIAVPAFGADYDTIEKSPLVELHLRVPETAISIAPLKEKNPGAVQGRRRSGQNRRQGGQGRQPPASIPTASTRSGV